MAHLPAYFRVPDPGLTGEKRYRLSSVWIHRVALSLPCSSSSSSRLAGAFLVPAQPTLAALQPPAEAFSAAWEANRAKTLPTRIRLGPRRPREDSDSRLRQAGLHRLQETKLMHSEKKL